jgi:hypothetical protein
MMMMVVVMSVIAMVMMPTAIGSGFRLERCAFLLYRRAQARQHLAQYSIFSDAQKPISHLRLRVPIP